MTSIPEMLSQARMHQQAGRFAQAEQLCRQILQVDSRHAQAWCYLGEACELQGRLAEAETCYRRAIHAAPNYASAHNWLGIVLAQQGRLAEGLGCFRQAVAIEPANSEFHHNLAVACDRLGDFAPAIDSYRQALRLRPGFAQAHYNLGLALKVQKQRQAAIEQFELALRFQPNYPEAFNDLGNTLADEEKLTEAVTNYQKALRLRPDFAEAHYNFGIALGKQNKHAEAMAEFRQALRLKSDFADAHLHLGNELRLAGQMDQALAHCELALRYKPDLAAAHWNRALLWLAGGDFERGWPAYEWRWVQYKQARRQFREPQWDGSPLAGRTILLYAEQGLGDTMQFVRYVPTVKARGGKVIVECHEQLVPLFTGLPGIDVLVPAGAALPRFDVQAPLLSLPGIFHTNLATIPRTVPYLHANPDLVKSWRQELDALRQADFQRTKLRIGICWQGSTANPGDGQRSFPLSLFAGLAELSGVRLISLQRRAGSVSDRSESVSDRSDQPTIPLHDFGDRLDTTAGAFMDTAAIMKNLDLVISCDTAIAHLAGALAVPVWVAVPLAPDWRWLLHRDDSPWYPTMRLFRQTRQGQWSDVFDRMTAALRSLRESKRD